MALTKSGTFPTKASLSRITSRNPKSTPKLNA
ncbi:hypothetical protein V6Z11_A07G076900 [Gossypium hirsutum]